MKQIIETNYLGGILTINVYPEERLVEGKLFIPYECAPSTEYFAKAVCAQEDKFTEAKGIKLVKLKLSKKYHSKELAIWKRMLKELNLRQAFVADKVVKHSTKLSNINNVLEKDFEVNMPKKTKAKNPTKKNTSKKK